MLLQIAEERRHAGQLALDLGDAGAGGAGTPAVVEGTASLILWEVLAGIYDDLGLDRLGDGTFRALVLARVIEPASTLDTVRVLTEIGVASPHRVTFMRCLKRVAGRDYRAVIAQACHRHATRAASLAVVLYDVTSLHFEAGRDGAAIETTRRMGTGKNARDRRVACHYAFKRAQHDNRAINAMAGRAEKVASGERPLKKDRFVTFTDTSTSVNWDLVETVTIGAQQVTAQPRIPAEARTLLNDLGWSGH